MYFEVSFSIFFHAILNFFPMLGKKFYYSFAKKIIKCFR